jgi:L-rhamnose mutarotase
MEGKTGRVVERVTFLLQVRRERLSEYLDAHEAVWADMLEALSRAGWRNYSLFVREEDGLVVGYFETENSEKSFRDMESEDVNQRWQYRMADYFVPAAAEPQLLREYFHLD